jgi:hypothetical protein
MFERLYARDLRRLCARDERPGSRTAEKRDELSPSHDEHFPSRVGRIPIWFGLETSMPARGRAGSKSCRLEHGPDGLLMARTGSAGVHDHIR